jgi:hypothetical protein
MMGRSPTTTAQPARRDRISSGLQRDYLNDPENWKRYNENPVEMKKEWEQLMTHKRKNITNNNDES